MKGQSKTIILLFAFFSIQILLINSETVKKVKKLSSAVSKGVKEAKKLTDVVGKVKGVKNIAGVVGKVKAVKSIAGVVSKGVKGIKSGKGAGLLGVVKGVIKQAQEIFEDPDIQEFFSQVITVASDIFSRIFFGTSIHLKEYIGKKFAEVNSKLDSISARIDNFHNVIKDEEAKRKFRENNDHIKNIRRTSAEYLEQRTIIRKKQFRSMCEQHPVNRILYHIYDTILEEGEGSLISAMLRPRDINYFAFWSKLVISSYIDASAMYGECFTVEFSTVQDKQLVNETLKADVAKYDKHLKEVLNKLSNYFKEFRENCMPWVKEDILDFMQRHADKDHEWFTGSFLEILDTKYAARKWFIMSYGEVWGFEAHTFTVTSEEEGFGFMRLHGRCLMLSSVARKKKGQKTLAQDAAKFLKKIDGEQQGEPGPPAQDVWNLFNEWRSDIKIYVVDQNVAKGVAKFSKNADLAVLNIFYTKNEGFIRIFSDAASCESGCTPMLVALVSYNA